MRQGRSNGWGGLSLITVRQAKSLGLFGIDALPEEVEVDLSPGPPGFSIVGLPDAAVQGHGRG